MTPTRILLLPLLALLWLFVGAAGAQDIGPARYFDKTEIADESTLDTVVARDRVLPSTARPGRMVRVIELSFTSQHWKGLVWKHPARIYVPDGYAGGGNAGIIGTERRFFDSPAGSYPRHTIPGTQLNTEAEYAEGTAIDLGMPIMIFANPAEDYWGMGESDLTGYALKKAMETQDPTWNGYYPIVKSYLRAITLLHSLPGVRTERALLMGCSKRGFSVSVATGADPDRVAGVMATCYFGGNTLYAIAKKFAEFGPGVGGPSQQRAGPAYQPAEVLLKEINSPFGLQLSAQFDPYMWRDRIKPSFLVAIGTNDEFYALGSANSMLREMAGDKAFLAVDNLKHSWVSTKHLAAWRMWLAHTFLGRPIPRIETRAVVEAGQLAVTAEVAAGSPPVGVRLFHAYQRESVDWRNARWESTPMTGAGGVYAAPRLPLKPGHKLAYYVEVEDAGRGGPGYVSSLVETLDAAPAEQRR